MRTLTQRVRNLEAKYGALLDQLTEPELRNVARRAGPLVLECLRPKHFGQTPSVRERLLMELEKRHGGRNG